MKQVNKLFMKENKSCFNCFIIIRLNTELADHAKLLTVTTGNSTIMNNYFQDGKTSTLVHDADQVSFH